MKIALCFSGEPRETHLSSKSLYAARKFCENNNITLDVFCHFWTDVTKRKHVFDKNDHIVSKVNKLDLIKLFKPTDYVIEDKDSLDPYCDFVFKYIQTLIEPIGEPTNNLEGKAKKGVLGRDTWYICKDLERLKNQLKFTNTPPIGQLYSLCKSHQIRIDYEKKYNIQYDLVIRLRTDVSFRLPSVEKLAKITSKESSTVIFPQLWCNLPKHKEESLGIGVEYAMFAGSSKTLDDKLFNNYETNILKNLFKLKKDGVLYFATSHNFFPSLIMNTSNNITDIRCGNYGIKYKLEQMELYR
jgi:hypothetical protein